MALHCLPFVLREEDCRCVKGLLKEEPKKKLHWNYSAVVYNWSAVLARLVRSDVSKKFGKATVHLFTLKPCCKWEPFECKPTTNEGPWIADVAFVVPNDSSWFDPTRDQALVWPKEAIDIPDVSQVTVGTVGYASGESDMRGIVGVHNGPEHPMFLPVFTGASGGPIALLQQPIGKELTFKSLYSIVTSAKPTEVLATRLDHLGEAPISLPIRYEYDPENRKVELRFDDANLPDLYATAPILNSKLDHGWTHNVARATCAIHSTTPRGTCVVVERDGRYGFLTSRACVEPPSGDSITQIETSCDEAPVLALVVPDDQQSFRTALQTAETEPLPWFPTQTEGVRKEGTSLVAVFGFIGGKTLHGKISSHRMLGAGTVRQTMAMDSVDVDCICGGPVALLDDHLNHHALLGIVTSASINTSSENILEWVRTDCGLETVEEANFNIQIRYDFSGRTNEVHFNTTTGESQRATVNYLRHPLPRQQLLEP